jgi:cytochrome c peroxidase
MQFHDGRAKDVEEQAGMPITNPVEMAIPSEDFLMKRLSDIAIYKKLFAEAFPEEQAPITYKNLSKAIGAFERTLLTPSKWDDYLSGQAEALTLAEKKGLRHSSMRDAHHATAVSCWAATHSRNSGCSTTIGPTPKAQDR